VRHQLIFIFAFSTSVLAGDLSKDFGIGLTASAFQEAVEKIQAQHGDEMGFSLEDCKLTPND
jgi:hypothetical protein